MEIKAWRCGQAGAARLCLSLALVLTPVTALTQEDTASRPGSPILIIDQDTMFSNSLFGQRIQREANEAGQVLSDENRVIQRALEAEEIALTEKRKSMTPEAFSPLADAFDEKVQAIRLAQDQKSRDIARQVEVGQQEFMQQALPVLSAIVRERQALAILEASSVFLSSESIDITRDAIQRIDAEVGDGRPATEAPDPETPVAD